MQTITTIDLEIAKSVFQVHGVNAAGQVISQGRYAWSYFTILTGDDEIKSASPPSKAVRENGVQHRLPMLMFINKKRDANWARSDEGFSH